MQDPKELIVEKLKEILVELSFSEIITEVSLVENPQFGDFSSSVALKIGRGDINYVSSISLESALERANYIVSKFKENEDVNQVFDKIEVAGPGFINFFLSSNYLQNSLQNIVQKGIEYGQSNTKVDPASQEASRGRQKVMVEFTDPNPLKEFHIGHLYSNTVGESLSRLLESQGAQVFRACYQGDVGLHVAKAVWGILQKLEIPYLEGSVWSNQEVQQKFQEFGTKTTSEIAKFLGEAYSLGAKIYESDTVSKNQIDKLNKRIYDNDPEIYPLYQKAKQWSLDYFETIYARLGTKFDRYYFESEAGVVGMEIVKQHIGDVFVEDNGAVIFPKEKSGLHTRVFVNSLGLPTYEAKELGLAPTKYKDFPYDLSVIITGNEINEYFKVLIKALFLIEPELAQKTKHISHGMVRLPSGKMSSRTGDVITGDSLLDETEEKIKEEYEDVDSEILGKIAVAAVKYALLKSNIGGDITFSFDESISLSGNSGPYIQYSYVRTQSVLKKFEALGHSEQGEESRSFTFVQDDGLNTEESELLRFLIQFPYVIEQAAGEFAPNLLCNYLFELSQKFNLFYQKHSILNPVILSEAKNLDPSDLPQDDNRIEEIRQFRLALTQAVGQVLQNGLNLLGIETVEKM